MTFTDDLGRHITLKAPARRILSLAPAIAENLFAIGAGPLLVGVSTAEDYPPEVKRLPRVGDFGQPAFERIRALHPDIALVEIAHMDRATIENASARMQTPILVQMSVRYQDVSRHLEQLGQITGKAQSATPVAGKMRSVQDAVAKRIAGKPRTTVFVEISRSPLYAAGPGSFVDDLIRLAGGVNIVKGNSPFPIYSKEALLAADPEHYIIAVGGDMASGPAALPPPLDRLTASKRGNIHYISSDFLFRPTPRLADGLVALAKALHG